jgi:transcriptional regulator with XRE-family HTH domain
MPNNSTPNHFILFGQRLIELRKARGMSQESLSLESGIAQPYLSGVERGKRNISLNNICRLAEALSIEPLELLRFDTSDNE